MNGNAIVAIMDALLQKNKKKIKSIEESTNYRTIQLNVLSQLNEDGTVRSNGITSIPTDPGVYRVTTVIVGLPTGAKGYGTMNVIDGGSYLLYIYVDAQNDFYYSRVGSKSAPAKWYKLQGTEVNSTSA